VGAAAGGGVAADAALDSEFPILSLLALFLLLCVDEIANE
jgi:hypothetical protein